MHAWQQSHFTGDLANLVEGPSVRAALGLQNFRTEKVFAQTFESALGQRQLLLFLFGDVLYNLILERLHKMVALLLGVFLRVQRVEQLCAKVLLQVVVNLLVEGQRLDNNFGRLELVVKLLDPSNNLADLLVPEIQRFDNFFFRHFERASFHHHDALLGAGNNDVQLAGLLLGNGRVGHQLPVEQTHANGRNRVAEWQIGTIGGRRGGGHRNHIRVIGAVRRQNQGNNLGLIPPAIGKQRPHRAIDQPRYQNFLFRRPSLPLEKTSRNLSGRIGVFPVVHGQGEKVTVVRL